MAAGGYAIDIEILPEAAVAGVTIDMVRAGINVMSEEYGAVSPYVAATLAQEVFVAMQAAAMILSPSRGGACGDTQEKLG